MSLIALVSFCPLPLLCPHVRMGLAFRVPDGSSRAASTFSPATPLGPGCDQGERWDHVHGQCLRCGAPVGMSDACKYCKTPVPPPPVQQAPGPAICVCGVLAARRCLECDTAVCDPHADRFWPGQARDIPLSDMAERTVWDWATRIDRDEISRSLRSSRLGEDRCTDCRARFADSTLSRFRALPPGDDRFTREVAAAQGGFAFPIVFPVPAVGLGNDAVAWLSRRQHQTTAGSAFTLKLDNGVRRPSGQPVRTSAWVVADGAPNHFWVICSDGRVALAPKQGMHKGVGLYGNETSRRGAKFHYQLAWGGLPPDATMRLAQALSRGPQAETIAPSPAAEPVAISTGDEGATRASGPATKVTQAAPTPLTNAGAVAVAGAAGLTDAVRPKRKSAVRSLRTPRPIPQDAYGSVGSRASIHPASWMADPVGRHQLRYWDGASWTDHVSDDGVTSSDPV